MQDNKTQISPIPPEGYGDRFVKFITGITKPLDPSNNPIHSGEGAIGNAPISNQIARSSTDQVMDKAERQARKTEHLGVNEDDTPSRTLSAARSPSADRGGITLPVVEEVGEAGSTGGRSIGGRSNTSVDREEPITPARNSNTFPSPVGGRPPPTPPKDYPVTEKQLPAIPMDGSFSDSLFTHGQRNVR